MENVLFIESPGQVLKHFSARVPSLSTNRKWHRICQWKVLNRRDTKCKNEYERFVVLHSVVGLRSLDL